MARFVSAAGIVFVALVLILLHFVRRDVDVLMQPLSAYGIGPAGRWLTVALLVWAGSGWLILRDAAQGAPPWGTSLLIVFCGGLVLAAVLQMDVPFPPDEWTLRRLSWRGLLHIGGASAASAVFPALTLLLAPYFSNRTALRALAIVSAVAALTVFVVPFVEVRIFGLTQRVLAASILVSLLTAALSAPVSQDR